MFKKSGRIILLIFLIPVLIGLGIYIYNNSDVETFRYNKHVTLFSMNDPLGDDYGPGSYKYPVDPTFEPGNGIFDLTKFKVEAYRDKYIFDINFAEMRNPYGSPGGFMQLVQIYISDNSGKGSTKTEKPGANVVFDPKNPWQYVIKATSWNDSEVLYSDKGPDQEGNRQGIKAEVVPGTKTVRVTVLKSLLPGNYKDWKYYVLIGSQDGNGPDRYRTVTKNTDEWQFSGSNGSDFDPNVIDILAPARGVHKQEKMLSSFNIEQKKYAVIYPVSN